MQTVFQKEKLELNTKFTYLLEYSDTPGTPVDAVVVDIPFTESL